ncbi:MAG TPA: DNA polymerase IV [Clostridia bacterium]|nr:DNA polymerase IV [Clostridia bacterium]
MPEIPAKTYFHVDMDAFFVSVEELYDPSLKGKPVVVGGKANERGVVAAASYAARKFGVHSAMPLRTAAKLCPQAVFLDGHPERYRVYSEKVHDVLYGFTPALQMASIDEAYLDMTGTERLHGPPLRAAHQLHEAMKRNTGLNCSIGIATSRMVAKVCSDQAKPNGVLWIPRGEEASFLSRLDVRKIPGVGKVTEERLIALGIRQIGQLAAMSDATLRDTLGDWAVALGEKARGFDAGAWFAGEVGEQEDPKSVSHEHTFDEDTSDERRLESMLAKLSEMVCRRLREHGLHARTVQLKLRYTDFKTITRAHTLRRTTQVDTEIFEAVRELFRGNWNGGTVRLLGVQTSSFEQGEAQPDLLANDQHDRWTKALNVADRMRDRFGDGAVSLAIGMKSKFRERTQETPASLPGKKKE